MLKKNTDQQFSNNSGMQLNAENSVATIVLDDANNLAAILYSAPEKPDFDNIDPIEESGRGSRRVESIEKKIFIRKHQRLTEFTLSSYSTDTEHSNSLKEQFLALFPNEYQLPFSAIFDFSSLFTRTGRFIPETDFDLTINLESQYIINGIYLLIDLINAKNKFDKKSMNHLYSDVSVCIQRFMPLCKKQNLKIRNQLSPDTLKLIGATCPYFKEIFQNLLFNALQYGKQVDISYNTITKNMATIQLVASSLSEKSLAMPAEPFSQVSDQTYMLEASGIGIIIVSKLIEKMGGHLEQSFNSTFEFTFDLSLPIFEFVPVTKPELVIKSPKKESGQPYTILYIENDKSHIDLVTRILEKSPDIDLSYSLTAELGFELASCTIPDLILVDINLPDSDGFTLFRKLQSSQSTSQIPVIALSATSNSNEIVKIKNIGFKHFLSKPFKLFEFNFVIKKALGITSSQQISDDSNG